MKNFKKWIIAGLVALAVTAGSYTAYAASQYDNPAEALAALTGRDTQSVIDERQTGGKTFREIADEAGVLDEFEDEISLLREDRIQELLDEGVISDIEAERLLTSLREGDLNCHGGSFGRMGRYGFGDGNTPEGEDQGTNSRYQPRGFGFGHGMGWGGRN